MYRYPNAGHVKVLLGLSPNEKLPAEGMPLRVVGGVSLYVRPLGAKTSRFRRFSLRVRALCPMCGQDVAASRLHQHVVVHSKGTDA